MLTGDNGSGEDGRTGLSNTSNSNPSTNPRSELAKLLAERGVHTVDAIVGHLTDEEIDVGITTVRYFDAEASEKGPALLAFLIKQGAGAGWKPRAERQKAGSGQVTGKLQRVIRNACESPNGFSRAMARDMLRLKARSLGVTPDRLIDGVMGEGWVLTRPEPEFDWGQFDE